MSLSKMLVALFCAVSLQLAHADAILDIDGSKDKNVQPNIIKQEFQPSKIDTESVELLPYAGLYKYEAFDSRPVVGIKAAYHMPDLLFLELDYYTSSINGFTDPSDFSTFVSSTISGYDISIGINFMPGLIYLSENRTITSNTYLKYGIGALDTGSDTPSYSSLSIGIRLLLPGDRFSIQFGSNKDSIDPSTGLGSSDNVKLFMGMGIYF